MTYDEWKLSDPQEAREYEDGPEEDYQCYEERHYEQKHGERLPCGCIGSCDPYAHDTAWDWDGRHDAIYPQRVFMEPYFLDEEFSGWVLYSEDDIEALRPLKKFSSLQEGKDWILEDNQRDNSYFA